jgi:hypothetical protein
LLLPRLAWNLRKSGMTVNGKRVDNDVFVDLRSETALGSELTGIILFVSKGRDFRVFEGDKTVLHCQSADRKVGYPRTEVIEPNREDGGRDCETCLLKNAARRTRDDGKLAFGPQCMEVYNALFLHSESGEVYRLTLRGRSYRSFKPVVQRFFHVRLQGRLVNVPWYARKVTVQLALAEKQDYAIAEWSVGPVNDPDTIRWAANWVDERLNQGKAAMSATAA